MKKYFKISKKSLKIAQREILEGNIIIHSTDTLPGLAVDATNDYALKRLIKLKGRGGPFSIIVASIDMISRYSFVSKMNAAKINEILPGPYTVLLKNNDSNNLSSYVTDQSKLVGFRIPKHSFSQNLVKSLNQPIVTTSFNITGQKSILELEKVSEHFKEIVIFDDEKRDPSKGSTILDLSQRNMKIIRKGDGDLPI
ncbi:MAG: threonylcarbamoyl-AMP synthase [Candidatus Marinimicrobia bacterium]|nr:threonylcarbamoyl-AMP synthase [Candidatus Neomarinimicrobiota bacterium]